MARSDMTHMIMCMLSGVSEMKSQKLSCADCACGKRAVGLGLHRMDEVGKFDGVLNEEDGDVVADEVPVAFLGVELHCKAANVAREVERSLAAGDGREANKGRRVFSPTRWKMSARVMSDSDFGQLEKAMRTIAAGMHDALGDALMIEVEDFLAEVEVLDAEPGHERPAARCSDRRQLGCLVAW